MKKKMKYGLISGLLITGLMLIGMDTKAGPQNWTTFTLPSTILVVSNNTPITITNNVLVPLPPLKITEYVTFYLTYVGTQGASNYITGIDFVSPDGVTRTTTQPLLSTNACNGTNSVTAKIIVPETTISDSAYFAIDYATTTVSNTVTFISGEVAWNPNH
jgi:hypothetical protein